MGTILAVGLGGALPMTAHAATPPVVKEVLPHAGPPEGGGLLTIKGEGFVLGETSVQFGEQAIDDLNQFLEGACTVSTAFVTVNEAGTELTVPGPHYCIASPLETGTVDVRVIVHPSAGPPEEKTSEPNPPGDLWTWVHFGTGPSSVNFAPTVTAVKLPAGPVAGGNKVQIYGREFVPAETEVKFGSATAEVTGISPTEIEAKAPPAPGGKPETVNVGLKTVAGTSAVAQADHYSFGLPVVEGLQAHGGRVEGGNEVKITGQNLQGASAIEFVSPGGGTKAPSFKVISATEIEATAPAHEKGTVGVRVTTPSGVSPESEGDLYAFGEPFIFKVTPDEVSNEGASHFTIIGANFEGVSAVELEPRLTTVNQNPIPVRAPSFKVISPTEIQATAISGPEYNESGGGVFDEEPIATAVVKVTSDQGESKIREGATPTFFPIPSLGFLPPPRVERVQPTAGPITGGTVVHLIVFVSRAQQIGSVSFGQEQLPPGAFKVHALNHTNGTIFYEVEATAPPQHAPGTVDVSVTTTPCCGEPRTEVVEQAGSTVARSDSVPFDRFTYTPSETALPVVEAVAPGEGATAGGTRVTIKGKDLEGASAVKFGEAPAEGFEVKSGSEIVVPKTPAHMVGGADVPGRVDVTVTTPQGTSQISAADRFLYEGFGVESLEASLCKNERDLSSCSYLASLEEYLTQSAGLSPYFVLSFAVDSRELYPGPFESPGLRRPTGKGAIASALKSVRVDLPPGLAFNPQAVPRCEPGGHPYNYALIEEQRAIELRECAKAPQTQVGVEMAAFADGTAGDGGARFVAGEFRTFPVYNLTPEPGVPAEFGFDATHPSNGHANGFPVYLKGNVSWQRERDAEQAHDRNGNATGSPNGISSGDFHAYSEAESYTGTREQPGTVGLPDEEFPVLASKIILNATAIKSGFITLPSECQKGLTYHMRAESYLSETAEASTTTPTGVEGCDKVPFKPEISVTPGTSNPSEAQPGQPDGASVTVKLPQGQSNPDSADPHEVTVTLPEGMTVNPSQANVLNGPHPAERSCSEEEFGVEPGPDGRLVIREGAPKIKCDLHTKIGEFEVRSPDLPPPSKEEEEKGRRGQLRGGVYLAKPLSSDPESGEEYRVFLSAESAQYGVQVRLLGHVKANKVTGRLSTTLQTPELPFEESITRFDGEGETVKDEKQEIQTNAPLANPLSCGAIESLFVPYGGPEGPPNATPSSPFTFNGACPFPPPFNLSQAAAVSSAQAGGAPSFALKWSRGPEQQYLIATKTTLPPGLTGSIAAVPALCQEEQANSGNCPAASQIGVVRSASGAGQPYVLGGSVYLTAPYQGAPYGLAIVVPAEEVGPYNYGKIVSRAKIEVDPVSAQVTTTASVPAIVGGAPVRLREVEVTLNRAGFMRNPTNCSPLSIQSTLSGTYSSNLANPPVTATQQLSSPFQATGCSGLPFSPTFTSTTSAHTSRQEGASLRVKITQRPGEANIHSVETALPYQLPSRLTTLQKACTEGQFEKNPAGCPAASFVGTATAVTPLLRGPLTGRAILVSHGGREFPDLKLLLEGEGIKVDLTGHTDIKKGITYTRFETVPDSPVSSFETNFPTGPYSALGANGSFCTETITAKERVPLRRHGRVVRRHGHIVYTTIGKLTRHVPANLYMPTTIMGQNGAKFSQKTKIEVVGCGASLVSPNVLSQRIKGHTLILKVKTAARGTLTISGRGLKSTRKTLAAGTHTVGVHLSRAGIRLARQHQKITVRLTLKVAAASSSSTLPVKL